MQQENMSEKNLVINLRTQKGLGLFQFRASPGVKCSLQLEARKDREGDAQKLLHFYAIKELPKEQGWQSVQRLNAKEEVNKKR